MTDTILIYNSNNSGGSWWLSEQDWDHLAEAGWNVFWHQADDSKNVSAYNDDPDKLLAPLPKTDNEWVGAKARGCAKRVDSVREGIQEWEAITGESAGSIGCTCCGPPHDFQYIKDGEREYVSVDMPSVGSIEYPD